MENVGGEEGEWPTRDQDLFFYVNGGADMYTMNGSAARTTMGAGHGKARQRSSLLLLGTRMSVPPFVPSFESMTLLAY